MKFFVTCLAFWVGLFFVSFANAGESLNDRVGDVNYQACVLQRAQTGDQYPAGYVIDFDSTSANCVRTYNILANLGREWDSAVLQLVKLMQEGREQGLFLALPPSMLRMSDCGVSVTQSRPNAGHTTEIIVRDENGQIISSRRGPVADARNLRLK